mmetsp:Transcript_13848/g.26417  ORF Transcript_13848/g.26417 Transcript_13848/m.26417 type:complete len:215 (-) Transcript_13848:1726-2370(-)
MEAALRLLLKDLESHQKATWMPLRSEMNVMTAEPAKTVASPVPVPEKVRASLPSVCVAARQALSHQVIRLGIRSRIPHRRYDNSQKWLREALLQQQQLLWLPAPLALARPIRLRTSVVACRQRFTGLASRSHCQDATVSRRCIFSHNRSHHRGVQGVSFRRGLISRISSPGSRQHSRRAAPEVLTARRNIAPRIRPAAVLAAAATLAATTLDRP